MKIDKNKAGLSLGIFIASLHAIWSLCVAIMPLLLKNFIDWILALHHLSITFAIQQFNIINAIILIIITFVFGYVYGWLFGFFWNWIVKK